ncbi:EamA family transporter [Salmonella enterica subsp. enterica serovar Panama]|uniref:EamA family transporter n=1 Tax=Salmonella enterica subsp. enterica serovar Panama TaxID=29472 RepID=A0A751YZZ8_SALET|nr:EamA family transporter [Salmonella enterica subsp. enterica serovar Sandiego]EBR3742695.1 EamA family transporter [Salmonella enterica]EGS7285580.1 EamA family transporter [Salmonella enterica subsp. enterica serovar Panama]EGS7544132.1 EamA family transporter [Salmonella enterica subsp. enterica serovar Panama]EHC9769168.1 EamA family transporter [Salmonella enterica subsp. enterica serovar Panama]
MSEVRLQRDGMISVVIAATLWGSTGVSAQYLLETTHSSPATVTMLRMGLAGSLLLIFGVLRDRRQLLKIFTSLRDVLSLLFFTLAGAMAVQLTFLITVAASDAATATVLQFTSPAIVIVASCLLTRRMPGWRMVLAVCLAIAGAFLLVTHGSLTSLRISRSALTWGLISSVAAAFYVTWPVPLIRRYGAIPVVGWSLFIGGVLLFILLPDTRGTRVWGLLAILSAGYLIVVGTAVTFCLYLSGARKIGSARASAVCCIEPLVSAVLSVLLLHIAFGPADWTGTLMVLLAVAMMTR